MVFSNSKITSAVPLLISAAVVIFNAYSINEPPYSSFSLTVNASPIDLSGRMQRRTDLW